jgi:photosynthetic reaction center cytochrome c subunit
MGRVARKQASGANGQFRKSHFSLLYFHFMRKRGESMSRTSRGIIFSVAALALALVPVTAGAQAPSGAAPQAGPAPKKAEEVFKNIQVLKGVPASQIFPAMQFIAASLGVRCDHCHVMGAFDKDDKEAKKTARKMMEMMFAINKDNFNGRQEVTCNSCHHGAAEPVAIPPIAEAAPAPQPAHAEEGEMHGRMNPPGAKPPEGSGQTFASVAQVLNKYVQALGGTEALGKISSRVEKGTISGFGPRSFPIDIFAKAPDKRVSVVHMPNGDNTTAFDGQTGWHTGFGGHIEDWEGADLYAVRLDADFQMAADAMKVFRQVRMGKPEKIGDRETWVLLGITPGQPPVKLYFDKESGMLLRQVRFAETPVGRFPTQVDYADFREEDGIEVPLRWTVARPGSSFTIQADQIQQNVPVDDSKFAKPAAPAPPSPEQKPPTP